MEQEALKNKDAMEEDSDDDAVRIFLFALNHTSSLLSHRENVSL